MGQISIHSSFNDTSTMHVIEWIYYYGGEAARVNDILPLPQRGLAIQDFSSKSVLGPKTNYWYRRGTIKVVNECTNFFDDNTFIRFMEREWSYIATFYNAILAQDISINLPVHNDINKLEVYSVCQRPLFSVNSKIEDLFDFLLIGTALCTKSTLHADNFCGLSAMWICE
mgnify:CR=1 FL=1